MKGQLLSRRRLTLKDYRRLLPKATDDSALRLLAKIASSRKDLFVRWLDVGRQCDIDNPFIAYLSRPKRLGKEVDPGPLVPRRIKSPLDRFGTVAVRFDSDFTCPIERIGRCRGRRTNDLVVNGNHRTRRVGTHRHSTTNTTSAEQQHRETANDVKLFPQGLGPP